MGFFLYYKDSEVVVDKRTEIYSGRWCISEQDTFLSLYLTASISDDDVR